jgi:short-subunit dehydrogenase
VLIARNLNKLNDCAKEIEFLYQVKTKVVIADFEHSFEIDFFENIIN